MKENCEIIRDILPLYVDGVCSEASRELVEKHLGECTECAEYMEKLKNDTLIGGLETEKDNVIKRQAKKMRRTSFTVGLVFAAILMIPILVCLIVNIAAGHALDWFFIVLFSLAVFASFTVVPLVVSANRFLWSFGAFVASLLALLATCCIYSGGKWFFIAATAVLFGLSVCFLPIVVNCAPIKRLLGKHRTLTVFAIDTILLYLLLISVGTGESLRYSLGVSFPIVAFVWLIMLIIRYLPLTGWSRAGLCIYLFGGFMFSANTLVGRLIGFEVGFPEFHPFFWNWYTLDGNLKWLTLVFCLFLGSIFVTVGAIRRIVRK